MRLLGLLSPLAVRLLQVRALAREDPERPASQVIDPVMLAVLAQRCGGAPGAPFGGCFLTGGGRPGWFFVPPPRIAPLFGNPPGKLALFVKHSFVLSSFVF